MDARISSDVLDDPRWLALSLEARVFYVHLRGWLAGEADARLERSCLGNGLAREILGPEAMSTDRILEELAAKDGALVVLGPVYVDVLGQFTVARPPKPKAKARRNSKEHKEKMKAGRRAAHKEKVREKDEFADSVFANWNDFAKWANTEGAFARPVATVRATNKKVRRHVLSRYKDPDWQGDYWPPMLERLKSLLPHWRGENGWVINLDYLVRNDGQAEALLQGQWSEQTQTDRHGGIKISEAEAEKILKKMEKDAPWA